MVDKIKTSDESDCGLILTRESDLASGRFGSRLQEAKGGESTRRFAVRAGLSEKVVRQYLNGESDPSRLSLARMARAAGVNIGWLATGEGPMKTSPQVTDERATYTAPARESVDLERLKEALRGVKKLLEEKGVTLPPEDEAQLVTWVYDTSRMKDLVEKSDLVGLLDLIY